MKLEINKILALIGEKRLTKEDSPNKWRFGSNQS